MSTCTWYKNVVREHGTRTQYENVLQELVHERGTGTWYKNVVQECGTRTRLQELGTRMWQNVVQERDISTFVG